MIPLTGLLRRRRIFRVSGARCPLGVIAMDIMQSLVVWCTLQTADRLVRCRTRRLWSSAAQITGCDCSRLNPLLTCVPLCAGEYKVILQLVSVLSHGKLAKRLTDRAIDQMQDVQNLRKAIYEYVQLLSDLSLSAGRGKHFVEVIQEH